MRLESTTVRGKFDDGGILLEDVEAKDVAFEWCSFSRTERPDRRSTARRIQLTNCAVDRVSVGPAILDEVVIDRLKTRDVQFVEAAAFRHVVLKGQVGRVDIRRDFKSKDPADPVVRRFQDANREFYQSVDWALDIVQADATELHLEGVPGHLIRRDPANSALVTREQALRGTWRTLDLSGSWGGCCPVHTGDVDA